MLAGLFLAGEPTSFSTLAGLFQFSRDELREAISEASAVFLTAQLNEAGDTLYQLTPPSIPFVEKVSKELSYFGALQVKVQHFRAEGQKANPREAALIATMNADIWRKEFQKVVSFGEGLPAGDLALENPRIKSLLGYAYTQLGRTYWERG